MSICHSVVVVEDDSPTRDRLSHIIDSHARLRLVAACASCAEVRAHLAREGMPEVLLVDLGLPDGNGEEIIRETQLSDSPPEVMVITVFGDERHVVSAIEAGAMGYLLKDAEPDDIGEAILQLPQGGSPISSSIARHLLKRFRNGCGDERRSREPCPALTPRELEILTLVTKGFSNDEIARMLGVSINTVTSHIKHTYRKLAVKSRSEAVFEALQLGIVNVDRSS